MADELRPEVIAAMTAPTRLPTDKHDAIMDASDAELAVAARVVFAQTADMLQRAGALPPTRSILDVGYGQMSALAAAFVAADTWWNQPGLRERSLGDLCKVIPAGEAERIMRILRWAGFLPAEIPGE